MADNIPLIVEVQTKGVKQAASDLQALEKAASSAEKSTGGMSSGVNAVNAQLAAMGAKAKNAGSAFRDLDPAARALSNVAKESEKASQSLGKLGSQSPFEKISTGSSKAATGVKKAADELNRFGKEAKEADKAASGISSAFSSLSKLAGGLFAGFSVAQFAGKLVSVQREFDVLNSALITITGSSAKAENEFEWIKSFASETPYSLSEVTKAFIKLKTLGLDASKESLTSYGNTASAMGKSLDQMIEAVADASTGEFERLKEFGIRAKKEGDDVSLTFQGVTKTIKNSSEEIGRYLTEIGNNNFAGAMTERAKTLDGAISNLGDSWDELFRTINKNNAGGLIFDSVKLATGAITEMISLLNAMSGATGDASRETGAFTTAQNGLKTVFETVAILGMNVKYVLVQIGNELGGLAAQAAAVASFNFRAAGEIGRMMKADAKEARAALDEAEKRVFNRKNFGSLGALSEGLPDTPIAKTKSTGGASGGSRSAKSRSVAAQASEEAKAYEDAMKGLASVNANAQKSTLELSAAQSTLYDLMTSPAWATMPEAWKQTAVAQFESARAAEMQAEKFREHAKAMEEGKKVMESMRTPEELLGAEIIHLNELLDAGAISWDYYARAVFAAQDKLDGTKEKIKETSGELDEFSKAAAKNIQDSLADFLFDPFADGLDGMALKFAQTMQRMAADAIAAEIAKKIFGTGKDGDNGLVGVAIKAISVAAGFHEGGVVGKDGGGASFYRDVSPGLFMNAKRYHSGGLVGDEVPAILKPGEMVLTKEQQKGMAGGGRQAQQNIRIVNAFDNTVISDYMGSAAGEKVIMNAVRRNQNAFKQAVA
jgi:hypothetical protein